MAAPEPLPEWTEPLVWTRRGPSPVYRFFAHVLIRLLVVTQMPAPCQVWVALLPVSFFWSWAVSAQADPDGKPVGVDSPGSPADGDPGGLPPHPPDPLPVSGTGEGGSGHGTRARREGALVLALRAAESVPSREELTEGRVHLDILAGRESVRGKTGGSDPVTLTSEGVVLTVPGLALAKDTALSVVARTGFSSFLPQEAGLEALQELVLDFSGQSLGLSAGLSVAGTTAVAGDTVVLARVERVQGIPRHMVVSLASVDATGKVTTVAHPDLPGVTREGRYVFYRLGVPIGLVKGTASAGGRALVVETAGLPFMGVASGSGADTRFVLVTQTGTVTVKGSVPGTSLQGQATTSVEPPTTASVVLALSGTVTQATVSPADGSSNLPTNTSLTITSPIPLASASVTTDKLKLRKVVGGTLVPLKLLLSGSGKIVSVLPQSPPPADEQEPAKPPLEFSTEYRLDAAELMDAFGGLVEVPETSFTTKDDVPPVYDYGQLSFRLKDGVVTLVAPNLTFPPGTQVLIINANTGEVASFTVGNSGGFSLDDPFPATFLASADHTLVVTITDPLGNTTTFTKSQFVTEDGKVLVGPGGGVVTGEGGVELRIPEGALEKGVELKLKGMTAGELAALFPGQAPGFGLDDAGQPVAKIGSGVELKSDQKPSFKKPVDLAFPVPAEALQAAQAEGLDEKAPYFYVVRRIEGPCATGATSCPASDRSVAYQTIDHAFVQCPAGKPACAAEEKKVVTASWPFGGYVDFMGGFGALPGSGFLLQAAASNFAYLLWTFDEALPGKSLAGVITGKVQRTEWNPGALTPTYEPVSGAYVSGVDASGMRLLSGSTAQPNVAISDKDGVFTLWDPQFKGGTVTLAATLSGGSPEATCPTESDTVVCATGFEADPADWKTSGLRFHQNIATLNLTFPPREPPPAPPAIEIAVYKLVEGKREVAGGLVPVGTPLVIGITPTEGIELREVTIGGEGQNLVVDPLKGEPTGHDFIVETTPQQVATYRVKALGLNFRAEAIESQTTYRAIGAGGQDETVEGQRPEVLDPDTKPKNGAKGVPVGTSIYVRFSEPVKKVMGNVTLKDPAGSSVGVLISGTLKGGGIIDDLATSPDAVVTSLTLQPLQGLVYTTSYTLELGDGIEDLDTVPQKLEPYTTSFETFGPVALREGDPTGFGAVAMVILEDRAYVMAGGFNGASMLVFETSDPVNPQPIPSSDSDPRDPRFVVTNRPVDITGEVESPLGPSRVVAVSTSSTNRPQPSNVWLLDVSDDAETKWIGAVSFTASPQEGWIERTAMRSGVLYAASHKKGIQLVDLATVRDNFSDVSTNPVRHFEMRRAIQTSGQGWGGQDVVSIPVPGPAGGSARLTDIAVGVVNTAAEPKLLVTAAGDTGLTVVQPGIQAVLSNEPVSVKDGTGATLATLIGSTAVAMGTVADKDVTVVVGGGSIGAQTNRPMLMTVSLLDPANPVGLGFVEIGDPTVEDVILKDDLALLGGATFTTAVSLADPAQPRVAGIIQGIAGRLALTPDGLLFGSAYSRFGGAAVPLGGVRTAALGSFYIVRVAGVGASQDYPATPKYLPVDRASAELRLFATSADPQGKFLTEPDGKVVLYGGSVDSTSDKLKLAAFAKGSAAVASYSWSVSGPGADVYLPSNASIWDVGSIKPVPGRLRFEVLVAFEDGKIAQASKDVEVGIRTDDVIVVGWIDPARVLLNRSGVRDDVITFFPEAGKAQMSSSQKGLSLAYLAYLALLGRNSQGNILTPASVMSLLRQGWASLRLPPPIPINVELSLLTVIDRDYILNWMFRHGANDCSRGECPPSGFASSEDADNFVDTQVTSYKLFSRFQVKYRIQDGLFKSFPVFLQEEAEVGWTHDPLLEDVPLVDVEVVKGEYGPANRTWRLPDQGTVAWINDGTPTSKAVRAFDALASPYQWSHIGSRIKVGVPYGTGKNIVTQVYPTYYVYVNGERKTADTVLQAAKPIQAFSLDPYPPGPAPFIDP